MSEVWYQIQYTGVTRPPAAAPDFEWYRPADEPVLPPDFRDQLESFFAPANWEAIISTDSGVFFEAWVQPIQQPVLPVEYRYLLPFLFRSMEPIPPSAQAAMSPTTIDLVGQNDTIISLTGQNDTTIDLTGQV